jgi:DNA-binding MarR family transcriptional regulator
MNKIELLEYLDSHDPTDADDIADVMQMSYSATAMALMRLVRQDLAARHIDPDTQLHVYEITPKGEARLDFFLEREINDD